MGLCFKYCWTSLGHSNFLADFSAQTLVFHVHVRAVSNPKILNNVFFNMWPVLNNYTFSKALFQNKDCIIWISLFPSFVI